MKALSNPSTIAQLLCEPVRSGFYREPGSAGAGVYPQETRLLPILARPPRDERTDVQVLNSMQIWSPAAGRMIPLSQVTSGSELVWENPIVVRRDRFPVLTVHADPRSGLPSQLFNRIRGQIEAIELPPGTNCSGAASTGTRADRASPGRGLFPTRWRSWS